MRHNILRVVSVLMAALLAIHSSAAVATAEKTQAELQAPYEAAMEENLKVPLEVLRVALIINVDQLDESALEKNWQYFKERMENCWRIKVEIVETFVLDKRKTGFQAKKIFHPYSVDDAMVEWKKLFETTDKQGQKVNIPQLVNDWAIDSVLVYDRELGVPEGLFTDNDLSGLESAVLGPTKYHGYANFEGQYRSDKNFFSPKISRDLLVFQLASPSTTLHGLNHIAEDCLSIFGLNRIFWPSAFRNLNEDAFKVWTELKDLPLDNYSEWELQMMTLADNKYLVNYPLKIGNNDLCFDGSSYTESLNPIFAYSGGSELFIENDLIVGPETAYQNNRERVFAMAKPKTPGFDDQLRPTNVRTMMFGPLQDENGKYNPAYQAYIKWLKGEAETYFASPDGQQLLQPKLQAPAAPASTKPVSVQGANKAFVTSENRGGGVFAYTIGDNNYVPLVGTANVLRYSEKARFEVNWSYEKQAYIINSGKRQYAGRIGEEGGTQGTPINRRVIVDGKEMIWGAYRIGDIDYFDVNDLARALDMNLEWIPQSKTFYVDLEKHYDGPPASSSVTVPSTPLLTATPTSSTVLVNGVNKAFDAYTISGNNYFKLRDVAYVLSGTKKQFGVSWDGANNAIGLTSGQPYTAVGGEMGSKGKGDKTPTPTSSKIFLDGKEVSFTAYTIEGNNYFKLRDIAAAFDFGVDWDGAANTIAVDTDKGYIPG